MLSVGVAVGLGLFSSIFVRVSIIPIFVALIGAYIPIGYLQLRAARRMRAFEENFGEAIDLLARAARAGHSLPTGLEVVADEAEEPVAGEFRQVYEEQRFGLPMNDALLGLADRVDLIDVRIFVTAVMIQRESGGNLAENLDSLSHVIRGRFRFKRDVKTKTAHGRMTGMVVGSAPFVAGIAMYTLNPEYMAPLFEEPMGQMMLMGGGAMMLMGFYLIRRITDVKV
jgi:tight adherence protein B